jgi:hypothetical protein
LHRAFLLLLLLLHCHLRPDTPQINCRQSGTFFILFLRLLDVLVHQERDARAPAGLRVQAYFLPLGSELPHQLAHYRESQANAVPVESAVVVESAVHGEKLRLHVFRYADARVRHADAVVLDGGVLFAFAAVTFAAVNSIIDIINVFIELGIAFVSIDKFAITLLLLLLSL